MAISQVLQAQQHKETAFFPRLRETQDEIVLRLETIQNVLAHLAEQIYGLERPAPGPQPEESSGPPGPHVPIVLQRQEEILAQVNDIKALLSKLDKLV